MSKKTSIELDLLDKESIKAATIDLLKVIEDRRRELSELEQKYEQLRAWSGLAASRKKAAKAPATLADALLLPPEPSTQDEVVRILNETKRPMNTMEMVVHMGTDANPKTVNWAMWDAATNKRLIKRVEGRKGYYAALDYKVSPNGDSAEEEHPLSGDSTSEVGLHA